MRHVPATSVWPLVVVGTQWRPDIAAATPVLVGAVVAAVGVGVVVEMAVVGVCAAGGDVVMVVVVVVRPVVSLGT